MTTPHAADTAAPKRELSPSWRVALDFGPILLFFLANFAAPVPQAERVYVATGVFMVATAVAMLLSRLKAGAISPLLWVSGAMVIVFGGLTLWLHNDTFIKVKPTIYYLMVSALLFVGVIRRRPTLKLVLGAAYPGLSERGWQLLSRNWAWFFLAMAIANEIVWRNFGTNAWIAYKLWGAIPATLLFAIANTPLMMRHGLGESPAAAVEESPPQG